MRGLPLESEPSDEGGEPACWLERVCPECGALVESGRATCWRCGDATSPRNNEPS